MYKYWSKFILALRNCKKKKGFELGQNWNEWDKDRAEGDASQSLINDNGLRFLTFCRLHQPLKCSTL